MGINKAILIGNVGRDPEVQYVKEDVPVARFTLATSETYRDKNGEKITNTEWHNIVVWRGLAKVVEQYVKKGDPLYIEGKITTRSYDKDGVTKYFTEIVVNNMQMLGKAAAGSFERKEEPTQVRKEEPTSKPEQDTYDVGEEDDLPF
ncbi:MAG: single-stranded DNA-binding protein [Bacteroidia bacterium]|nr:MAG: single-stranded DNA-binding protein [Bacteroidia bacterium]